MFKNKPWFQGALTPENKVYLHAGERQSTLPVYLLISPESASATEIMTLTSLEIPSVTRIGDRTEGVFSDIFDREMPNGMEFGLSNEVYYSMKGENYEGLGIPADVGP
ncbi:S41 family peptidase [Gilvibacter sp.]|uniref:S41 family peptidase n=1 Tax=Gilvibacter sp. TaxID=2729997 RepID=UPI003F4A3DA1